MSNNGAPWASLAARVVRVAMMRKDIGYAELSRRLATIDVVEDERSLASRVAIGRVRLAMFLQMIHVLGSEIPSDWQCSFREASGWEDCAARVVAAERAQIPPMSTEKLAVGIGNIGAGFKVQTLMSHLDKGNITLSDFLRCLVVLRSHSLDDFIDYRDLVAAAELVLSE
ncbi:DUF6471 domain-containing protein [Herbaspirillum sp. BH-1]|uniref:DUF6471 domain-containing protein n=1 Tax=Herbaspirillum sp. (strain BH-1) TaxID=2058884 RepID=UPI0011AF3F35|nr:DUF6471 domain-containing protein [Herbaspirillum sp. BH-1]